MRKILLIGGGGHCCSVLDSILTMNCYDDIGIIDSQEHSSLANIPVVGQDEDLPNLFRSGWKEAFITVGSVGNTSVRRRLYNILNEIGYTLPILIDSTAIVARDVTMESGIFVGKRAVINAGSRIGKCAIINTGAIVEHDCLIGDFSHISPGTVLCGEVCVGNDTHIGAGTVIKQQINIGNGSLIGIGSNVVKDIPEYMTAYGNPCKVVK